MEKDAEEEFNENYEVTEIQLNQNGRPKQKVIFYELTQQMKEQAILQLQKDQTQLSQQVYEKAQQEGQKVWDKFYKFHKCNFFRDRTYLERQMPEITFFKECHQEKGTVSNYYELGCGVGNTLFPLLRNFGCFNYYGCDISKKAIELIEEEMEKHEDLKQRLKVCVCDLVKDEIPYQQTGDLCSLIFVLSAIVPQMHFQVMKKVSDSMKPGSFLFFRDYGRYDFGQLNLSSKGNRKLKDNFYMKNDGVCVFYFDEKELQTLCKSVGLVKIKINLHCKLLQNRKTGLKMYRVWIQGRFYKPPLNQYFIQKLKAQQEKEEQEKLENQNIEQEIVEKETFKNQIVEKEEEKAQKVEKECLKVQDVEKEFSKEQKKKE